MYDKDSTIKEEKMNIKEARETLHVLPDSLRYSERVGAIPKVNSVGIFILKF